MSDGFERYREADREFKMDVWFGEQRQKVTLLAADLSYAILSTANNAGLHEDGDSDEGRRHNEESIRKMLDRFFRQVKRLGNGPEAD